MTASITVVVPMAGEGSRFAQAGYKTPKPFIRILGRPVVSYVLDNISYSDARYVLIAQRAHVDNDPEAIRLLSTRASFDLHLLDRVTEGTACTVLEARAQIPPDLPLLIANSDQYVLNGVRPMLDDAFARKVDGSIMVFHDNGDPKWSFARVGSDGYVIEVAEKKTHQQSGYSWYLLL